MACCSQPDPVIPSEVSAASPPAAVGRKRYCAVGAVKYHTASLGIEVTADETPVTSTSQLRVATVPRLEVAVTVTG